MQLHTLKPFAGSKKPKKRIGRGLGSGHGAYSTRGVKGQRARSGGSHGLKARGLKMFLLRVPKTGGFKSIHAKALSFNVEALEKHFNAGDTVTLADIVAKKIVRVKNLRKGVILSPKTLNVKILGNGKLTKKLTIKECEVSQTAQKKIEAVGGEVETLA